MIRLYNVATDQLLGIISEAEFEVLANSLEEETLDDQDYYINQATLDLLQQAGATEHLIEVLETALDNTDEVDIRWEAT